MMPAAPADDADQNSNDLYKRRMKQFVDEFELTGAIAQRA